MGSKRGAGLVLRRVVTVLAVAGSLLAITGRGTARTAMYSADAGFHQARYGRTPIAVAVPDPSMLDATEAALDHWNQLAGWNLLRFGVAPRITFLTWQPSACVEHDGCASMLPNPDAPYVACEIWVQPVRATWPPPADVIAHEIGHCLGFTHQQAGVMTVPPAPLAILDRTLLAEGGYADQVGRAPCGCADLVDAWHRNANGAQLSKGDFIERYNADMGRAATEADLDIAIDRAM